MGSLRPLADPCNKVEPQITAPGGVLDDAIHLAERRREGTFSFCDWPSAPWQARQGAIFSDRSTASAGDAPASRAAVTSPGLPTPPISALLGELGRR